MSEAKKLNFDNGVIELDINGNGILRFAPSDFGLYRRFLALSEELPEIEKEYATGTVQIDGDDMAGAKASLDKASEIDRLVKEKLSNVFGKENDFDQLLGGVNVMAFGSNGERVITNLLNALAPYIERGIKQHMKGEAAKAVAEANLNRAQRRSKK